LRQQLIPSAFAGSGAQVYVGGKTADEADYFHAVTSPTPYVLVFVLGLSFLLLLLAFRSLTIAAVSILLTLVFIHGAGVGHLRVPEGSRHRCVGPAELRSTGLKKPLEARVAYPGAVQSAPNRHDQVGQTGADPGFGHSVRLRAGRTGIAGYILGLDGRSGQSR